MSNYWSKPSLLRDFSLLAVFIILMLCLVSLWVTFETYQDNSERIFHQLETEATRIDRAMILEINHSSYLIESLGRQITNMNTHDLNSIALLLRSFDTAATAHHVFSWIDENQTNVVSSNQGVHKPIDVSDRDFVQKATQEPGKVQVGSPMQGRVSAKWVLPVALGLTDNTGKYIGTILISLDIATITRNLHAAIKDSGIQFSIYSSKSILPLTQTIKEENPPSLIPYIDRLKSINFTNNRSGILSRGSIFDNNNDYVYYELSANYPYIILVELANQVSLNSIKELLLPRLIQIFLMGLFMLTVLWVVKIRVISPISNLREITADITRGKPFRSLGVTSAKEIHLLAEQIRHCAEYIEELRRIDDEKENKNALLRRVKDHLEFSNQINAEFLAAMSHEFRTPLNTVIGFSEIMKNQSASSAIDQKYIRFSHDIHEAAQQLKLLLEDVIVLSNATAREQTAIDKSLDIRVILHACIQQLLESLQHKINVEFRFSDTLPRLLIDEVRFKQVITNILVYIIAHYQEDSSIIVECLLEKNQEKSDKVSLLFSYQTKSRFRSSPQTGFSALSIFLTKVLVAMSQGTLDVITPHGKTSTIALRFPEERIIY